eukprot:TRINITY_DN14515_c0_g1_i1.p1 TRINITY_DN14515_c0_g1~~TRINITY_DN14515_c0_g1_i1.p1  ORF type:complete len:1077 (+),score=274.28 TRINITY_DN14515_c0_g1_i1:233-3232(+)
MDDGNDSEEADDVDEDDDDVDEDDDDEDDDGSEDDEERARAKRVRRAFFQDEASDVEDDETSEDDEGVEDSAEAAEALALAQQIAARRRPDRLHEAEKDEDIQRIAEDFERRARTGRLGKMDERGQIQSVRTAASQSALQPTVNDTKLWTVRCKPGHEREIALALWQKYRDLTDEKTNTSQLLIHSVLALDNLKGFFYVEADRESYVTAAITGIRTLFKWQVKLVPLEEMVRVVTVSNAVPTVAPDTWVRCKRGIYKGDIAQVVNMDEQTQKVRIKLIPRLDLSNTYDADKRKRADRPPQKFFNPDEIGGMQVEKKRDAATGDLYYMYNGNRYMNGYLYKLVAIKTLDIGGITPSLQELQIFQSNQRSNIDADIENEDDALLPPILQQPTQATKVHFAKGDFVKVISGDLKNLTGTVEVVDGDTVIIMPKQKDLNEAITMKAHELKKSFQNGDHVKVINGRYEGETGLVMAVEEDVLHLFADLTMKEIKVFAKDVQAATEVASGLDSIGNFGLFDLVTIDPTTVGVIVKVERESFKLLDNRGNVRSVKATEMGRKRFSRDSAALDARRNNITAGDQVHVLEGPMKGRAGQVKHIFRQDVFVVARDQLENSGCFVVKARVVQLVGANMKVGQQVEAFMPLRSPAPAGRGMPAGRGGAARGGFGRGRQDALVAKTVKVRQGPWKGYVGIVKDASDRIARVELHSVNKIIDVDRAKLETVDSDGRSHGAGIHGATPMRAMATPMWDNARTPMHDGMRTPMHDGMRTPMRDGFMRTPMHDGSATPLHDAWNANVPNTPARKEADLGDLDDWSGPANQWGGSYTTPAAGTPSARTPSATYYDAPTPQSSSPYAPPQTPGGRTPATGYPYTPGVSTSTPGATTSTPGAGMFDDVPYTPSASYGNVQSQPWHLPGVEVSHSGRTGVITTVDTGLVGVQFKDQTVMSVAATEVEKVQPQKKDRVKIVSGDHIGKVGTVLNVDGSDRVIKLESGDIKIFTMAELAKLA